MLVGGFTGFIWLIVTGLIIIIRRAYEERRDLWLMDVQAMRDICLARGGKNCKNCICYGKQCEKYKRHFHNTKPMDYDPFKEKSYMKKRRIKNGT